QPRRSGGRVWHWQGAAVRAFKTERAMSFDELAAATGVTAGGAVQVSVGAATNFADVCAFLEVARRVRDTVLDERDLPAWRPTVRAPMSEFAGPRPHGRLRWDARAGHRPARCSSRGRSRAARPKCSAQPATSGCPAQ